MSSQAVKVFFSYSHKDEALRNELANHLNGLKLSGAISGWHDRKILPGDEWDRQIKDNLNSAQIILLLVSSDFIASRYCQDVEITRAMERHEAGEAQVIPVILRRCLWHVMPFGKLQALPKNGMPVVDASTWATLDDAFYNVAEGIYKVAQRFAQAEEKTRQSAKFMKAKPATADQLQKVNTQPEEKIVTTAQTQYRERVQEYLIDRELTTFHEIRLDIFKKQLKLSETEAKKILSEELAPIEQAKKTYREALSQFIEAGHNPLSESTRQELAQIQQELQLTEAEVSKIEQPVLAATEYKFEVLGSECGINYTKLRDLLKSGEWEAADKETYEVMIRAVGKASGGYFSKDELLNFPCQDLQTIDRLWVKYSNGQFGFSVQKKIYVECGATLNGEYPGNKIWVELGNRLGWLKYNSWLDYNELTFSTLARTGHLPFQGLWGLGWAVVIGRGRRYSFLASRLITCHL